MVYQKKTSTAASPTTPKKSSTSANAGSKTPIRSSMKQNLAAFVEKISNNRSGDVKITAPISNANFETLVQALSHNTSSLVLDLSSISVTAEQCGLLSTLMQKNKTLECIDLSLNSLGDDACTALAPGIAKCSLDRISLNDNNITDYGIQKLAAVRPRGLHIAVRGNKISQKGLDSIAIAESELEDSSEDERPVEKTRKRKAAAASSTEHKEAAAPTRKASGRKKAATSSSSPTASSTAVEANVAHNHQHAAAAAPHHDHAHALSRGDSEHSEEQRREEGGGGRWCSLM